MHNQLQKALNLAKKTGDRIIIFDNVGAESPYVVMGLDEYEKLIIGRSEVRGLTEDELLDKINRDIAIWKSEQDQESGWERMGQEQEGGWDRIDKVIGERVDRYYGPEMMADADITGIVPDKDSGEFIKKRRWTIPKERKEGAEEIIEDDRQYLEEI